MTNPASPKSERPFDVILFGATGFTGALVAEHLRKKYSAPGALRWAIAGRSESKLEALRDDLALPDLPLVIADSEDRDSLAAMAAQARVICTTVGPYSLYGSQLVAACVDQGTDYVDLTGETHWIRRMIDTHAARARETGARIVHCCGFDSIPSDLGVFFLQEQAVARHGETCQRIDFYLKAARGAASGGTAHSLLEVIKAAREDRQVARTLSNPYGLNPDPDWRGPDARDQRGPRFAADIDVWTAPFIMAAINTRIVRRSNALMDFRYGEDFRYSESMITGPGAAGRAKALAISAGLAALVTAAAFAPSRALLTRFILPDSGEGPDKGKRDSGFYRILLHGTMEDGRHLQATVTGDRDPGYGSTSRMLGEAAVCLASDIPDGQVGGGFWTPASCLGGKLIERLERDAGLSFEMREG